ncbi:MAG: cupin domain-containing protein [Burkholderiales bacterium]|nr:cupin domain-containing protein [Burkholderiales bacterium]
MLVFALEAESQWNVQHHVERVLGKVAGGDVTIACWEPGQISPYHCHPNCTEIYFCYDGGGQMRTPQRSVDIGPGTFVVHPPGELHEYVNGARRTMLFRVRYGDSMESRKTDNRGRPGWTQSAEDQAFFAARPELLAAEVR